MTSTGCQATRKDGRPCGSWALTGSSFCFMHDPTRSAERQEARSRGGRARHGRTLTTSTGAVALGSVADVVKVLEGELGALLSLEGSVARARAVGYLCGQAVRALEVSELEARIAALEARFGG